MQRDVGAGFQVGAWRWALGLVPVIGLAIFIPPEAARAATSASGGAVSACEMNGAIYRVHRFTSNATLMVANGGEVEYLLVAGGGAGGNAQKGKSAGGGGGGGGVITGSVVLARGKYSIRVGAGGVNGNGGNSVFKGLTAKGGGKGGAAAKNGAGGGSGGGAGSGAGTILGRSGGAGTKGQGFAGGNSSRRAWQSGGGGGARGVGGPAGENPGGTGGNGGTGMECSITGTTQGYAGGGGGGWYYGSGGTARHGGGGGGGLRQPGVNGEAHTGGGGGGAGDHGGAGGKGGSGIVIVRYVTDRAPTVTASADPLSGSVPLSVDFRATGADADNDPLSYSWTFGDGATSSEQNPTHVYANSGSYTAVVTVTDPAGASGQASVEITVTEPLGPQVWLELRGDTPVLHSEDNSGQRLLLERRNEQTATNWQEIARVRNRLYPYEDITAAGRTNVSYRLRSWPMQSEDDWSNQLYPAGADLFTTNAGAGVANIRYVKFQFYLSQPDRIFFQDSARWDTHYAFAGARFPECAGMTVPEYDLQSLYPGPDQRMVAGSILRAPDPLKHEISIQIAGNEAFPIDDVADWIAAVRRRLVLDEDWQIFYMPSATQREAAEAGVDVLVAHGITLSSIAIWATENAGYSTGWALGRLVFVPGTEISAALGDGRLKFGDILVTDWVPAELPVLAGYLSLEPATPSSHVALLARALALPFAYANSSGTRAQISALYGKEILLVVEETTNECRITMTDTTGMLTPEQRQAILASKGGGSLDIVPLASTGTISLVVDTLTPADVRYVGGKVANFGFLRRSLPTNSPSPAIGLTFDLWQAYLAQTLPDGQTLRQKVTARLGGYTFPPDMAMVRADLAAVRALFANKADFTPVQRTQIVAALQAAGFGGQMIRFRSSTNVEDSDVFNGAGLYDSYSGCLEDDLDGDVWGPCRCDPTEPEERGVFRAIRKVYASFYNENAFLERLRHGVIETNVGMAILVHYSSPDTDEMANGVALLAIEKTGSVRQASANLVTQLGADSVTNPDSTKRPETVLASFEGTNSAGAPLTRTVASSLTINGDPVMTWETDYRTLLAQMNMATLAYEAYYTNRTSFELDFEFKRMAPGNVMLKQIRAVPHPVLVPPPVITYTGGDSGDYMIVDLSGGPLATNYPVSYMNYVPESGWTDEYKSTKLVLRRIPAGGFMMGSPEGEYGRAYDESQHAVILSHDVFVGVFEVTQKQWELVMGNWPSCFTNATCRDTRPVEQVSYDDIRGINAGANWPNYSTVDTYSFMGKLRARTGRTFDLPTESQWEYAGRAGVGTSLNSGNNVTNLFQDDNLAVVSRYWYTGGSNWNAAGFGEGGAGVDTSGGTDKVGSYQPNAWGLYDIHGNVWEWCLDVYDGYPAGPVFDPPGGAKIDEWPWDVRVWRGGAWDCGSEWYGSPNCRMACRSSRESTHLFMNLGFRVAAPPGP